MLAFRLQGQTARVEAPLVFGACALAGLIAWKLTGHAIAPLVDTLLAALACAVFGGQALLDTRDGVNHVLRLEQTPAMPVLK
jgi:hypothetical protein